MCPVHTWRGGVIVKHLKNRNGVVSPCRTTCTVYGDAPCYAFLGVMDKFHAKNRCNPYAARLYARSKPLNTKNAFSAAPNKSRKTGIVTTGNSNTIAAPVSTNSWGTNALIPTHFGSATAKASKAPHSLPRRTDAASKRSIATSAKPYTGRMRAATGTHEPHHGHHLFRP